MQDMILMNLNLDYRARRAILTYAYELYVNHLWKLVQLAREKDLGAEEVIVWSLEESRKPGQKFLPCFKKVLLDHNRYGSILPRIVANHFYASAPEAPVDPVTPNDDGCYYQGQTVPGGPERSVEPVGGECEFEFGPTPTLCRDQSFRASDGIGPPELGD